jgi:hypothetical protein
VLQRVLRDFIESPMYPKREANRRRAADSGRIVGKQEVIRLLPVCSSVTRAQSRETSNGSGWANSQ